MRITLQFLPLALLILLAPAACLHEWSLLTILFLLLGIFFLRTALLVMKCSKTMDMDNDAIILETIHVSHYVEKVRWCLDYLRIPYKEEKNVGILGVFLLGRRVPQLIVPGKGIYISNSPDILRYLYGKYANDKQKSDFLRPTPEALELEGKIDILGEDFRRNGYKGLFEAENYEELTDIIWGMNEDDIPSWQKWILKTLRPIFKFLVGNLVKTDKKEVEKSNARALKTVDEFNELLSDGRKYLLDTDGPTYVDFAFSAIMGIVLLPKLYGGPTLNAKSRLSPNQWQGGDQNLLSFVEKPVGKFVLRMYEKHRLDKI